MSAADVMKLQADPPPPPNSLHGSGGSSATLPPRPPHPHSLLGMRPHLLAKVIELVARCPGGPGDVLRVKATCKYLEEQVVNNGWVNPPPPGRWAFDNEVVATCGNPDSAGVRLPPAVDIWRAPLKTLLAVGCPEAGSDDETRTPITWLLQGLDSSGKPSMKAGFDDTDIEERLLIRLFRFLGDCHWCTAFPGLRTYSYVYNYRVLEAKYRAIALPLDAARKQLASLEAQEPGPVQEAVLAEVRTALAAAREYILSVQHIFAGKAAVAKENHKKRKAKYDGDNAKKGHCEYSTQQLQELHYLGEVVDRVSTLAARSDAFCAAVKELVFVVDVTLVVVEDAPGLGGAGGRVSLTLQAKPDAGLAEESRAAEAALDGVFGLLEDAFFVQRRAASKLLSIRIMDSSMFVSTSVARVTHNHGKDGPGVEDFRSLIFHIVSHARLISNDTVEIGVLSFDGEFRAVWNWGCTRPTTGMQLARQSEEEAQALLVRARKLAGVSEDATNYSAGNKVKIKCALAQAVMSLVRHSHSRRSPSGVPLHAIPAGRREHGEARDALEAKKEKTADEFIALLRVPHVVGRCRLTVSDSS